MSVASPQATDLFVQGWRVERPRAGLGAPLPVTEWPELVRQGCRLERQGDFAGAVACHRRAAAPESPCSPSARGLAHALLATALLARGDFGAAWPFWEARERPPVMSQRIAPWRGQRLRGRTILVVPEDGLGDQRQALRWLPLVGARGAGRVTYSRVYRDHREALFEAFINLSADVAKLCTVVGMVCTSVLRLLCRLKF